MTSGKSVDRHFEGCAPHVPSEADRESMRWMKAAFELAA